MKVISDKVKYKLATEWGILLNKAVLVTKITKAMTKIIAKEGIKVSSKDNGVDWIADSVIK